MDVDVDPALVVELAQISVAQVAPEELVVFDDTVADFFRDPDAAVAPSGRDEAVGFGLDVALATPYVLAVVVPVVHYLVSVVVAATKEESASVISGWVRKLFHHEAPDKTDQPDQPAPTAAGPALTLEQGRRVREIALEKARALGLSEARAALLADSVSGGLVTAG